MNNNTNGVRVLDEAQLLERIKALQAEAMRAGFILLASYATADSPAQSVKPPAHGVLGTHKPTGETNA